MHIHFLYKFHWFSRLNDLVMLARITARLEAILLEAKGSWAEAEKAYASLLEENPVDQVMLDNPFFIHRFH